MERENSMFLFLWGMNFLVSIGYCLVCICYCIPRRKEQTESVENARTYLLRSILMVLCPVFGPLYFGISFLLEHIAWFRDMDLSDVVFRKEKARTYVTVDEGRERDLAPIEETLEVGDKQKLRALMLNVLRGNLENSLGSIALALNSTDSETSHYAASVLRDELNDFRVKVQQLREEVLKEPEEECELEIMLFDYMARILSQKVFSDLEQKKYLQIFEENAENLYNKNAEEMTVERYDSLCQELRNGDQTTLAEKWTERLTEQYPNELSSYTNRLKLYFMENDREHFFEVLDALKKSNVAVDQETLELIRVFH